MVEGITRANRPVESNDYSRCDFGRAAIVLGALFAPAAVRAGEHCSVDDDFMRNCGFSSMEQCKAMVSGMDGGCFPNPSSKDTSIATINRTVYAYSPRPSHIKSAGRRSPAHFSN